jgi:hypothetical protein
MTPQDLNDLEGVDPREVSPELALVDPVLRAWALASDDPPQWATGPPATIAPLGVARVAPASRPRRRFRRALAGLAMTVAAAAVTFGALELPPLLHHSTAPVRPRPTPGRELAWAATPGANGYRVLVARDGKVVLDTVTSVPRVRLNLASGSYRWWVWPLAADGSRSAAIVQASLVVGTKR